MRWSQPYINQSNTAEQEELGFLDIITVLSFILQIQNRESHKIDQLRDEMSKEFDKEHKILLEDINTKLDTIIQYLARIERKIDFL